MENKKTDRPKCDWPVPGPIPVKSGETQPTVPCGSEDRIYRVSKPGKDYWGRDGIIERNICEKHLGDAWNEQGVDSAVPIDVPSRGGIGARLSG